MNTLDEDASSQDGSGFDELLKRLANAPRTRREAVLDAAAGAVPASLGPYRIVSALGRGGMGVVYAAEDTRLGRQVALKLVPPEMASNEKRLERLRREAQTLATLNHPNIVTVFALEESGGQHFFAMELVRGRPLSELIPEAGMSTRRLAEIVLPIVDALDAAHRSGIVHRDLKPANIMLSDTDVIKVLDFGLAKVWDAAAEQPRDAESQRATPARDPGSAATPDLTTHGRILGTLAYMSPEQLAGKQTDRRTDIFSIGVILHELATGRRPFRELTQSDADTAPRDAPPPRVPVLSQRLPREVGRIVRRCLGMTPDERYHNMTELRAALEPLRSPDPGWKSSARKTGWAIGTGLAVAALALLWSGMDTGSQLRWPGTSANPVMTTLVTWPSDKFEGRLSPDGKSSSFISNRNGRYEVWIQLGESSELTPLIEGSDEVMSHAWSPDGRQIAMLSHSGEGWFLDVVQAADARRVARHAMPPEFEKARLARWRSLAIFAEIDGSGLWSIDPTNGKRSKLLDEKSPDGMRRGLDISEDGTKLAYWMRREDRLTTWISGIDGEGAKQLTTGSYSEFLPRWVGNQSLVLSSNRSGQTDLWWRDVEGHDASQITFSSSFEAVDDASHDGSTLLVRETRNRSSLWAQRPDRSHGERLTADTLEDFWPSVAADGRMVVFQRSGSSPAGVTDLFRATVLTGTLTANGLEDARPIVQNGFWPRVSPDGRWMTFVRPSKSRGYELWLSATSGVNPRRLAEGFPLSSRHEFPIEWLEQNVTWSSTGSVFFLAAASADAENRKTYDDQHLLETFEAGKESIGIFEAGAEGGAFDPKVLITAKAGSMIHDLHLSPDGRKLSYVRTFPTATAPELDVVDLATRQDRVWLSGNPSAGNDLFSRGWLAGGSVVVLRGSANADWSFRVEVVRIRQDAVEVVGTIDRCFPGTARLDTKTNTLYVTKLDEGSIVQNLVAFSLDQRILTRVTDATLPGVSFAGVEVLPNGQLLYAQQERADGLYRVHFDSASKGT